MNKIIIILLTFLTLIYGQSFAHDKWHVRNQTTDEYEVVFSAAGCADTKTLCGKKIDVACPNSLLDVPAGKEVTYHYKSSTSEREVHVCKVSSSNVKSHGSHETYICNVSGGSFELQSNNCPSSDILTKIDE